MGVRFRHCTIGESPIEVELGARLTVALRNIEGSLLALVPQYVLARYRYDFAITRDGKLVGLVECDGKEFHSTEDQIHNDRAKNRLAAEKGVPISRFSGSEIYSNGKACVRLILHSLRVHGHLTQQQWDSVKLSLAPRPWYQGDGQFEADEDEYEDEMA